MLSKFFPGLLWLQGYDGDTFRSDLFSGLAIAVMLIPQGMGYAVVAGLPPEYGLYACIIPPVIYALLGTSNKISIGPVALDSILIITGLSVLAEPGSDHYLELAIALTLMVGVIQAFFGFIRFGFIANFLSNPVIVGYTSAAALIIMGSQFENMLGVDVEGGNLFQLVYQLLMSMQDWNWVTVGIGAFGLLFMVYSKRIYSGPPYALILLVLGMVASGVWNAQGYGVDVVSSIPQGLPDLTLPNLGAEDFIDLMPVALTVALMGYVGTMSICKSQEKPTDKISAKPNQELLAVGAANLVGAFFKAFPVSASFSRSAAFREAGAMTQVSALVSSFFILITVLFLTPYFQTYPLPKALLSAIIIVSVVGLFKYKEMIKLSRHSRREFAILMATFVITLLLGVQEGLFVGVALSIGMVIYNTANPHMTELGSIENGRLFRNVNRFSDAKVRDDVLIFRFDAPLYFANKDYFVEQLYAWIKHRQSDKLMYVLFDAEAVNSVDSTAIQMLQQVIENLRSQGVQFYITNAIGPVRDVISTSPMRDYMCEKTMFSTINDAIVYIDGGVNVHARSALQTNDG
ncbi:sulfate permease [Pseudomaricurvus alkylphenolicus]|uniref:SulP family inorganic anion transporter n=1 Tax=Pseudomaricurvus alkylphenolicus TaxID=1306991 RepID=UPI001424264D|nr:sulfate permease [Pseudomaricurvus alkylphenolicus]NIB40465.1 sulfate permease [Pseudomaricurvus alkylphenolicus]